MNCSVPLYLQPDIKSVEICSGLFSSYFWSCLWISIFSIFFLFILYNMFWRNNEKQTESIVTISIVCFLILIVIWIFGPRYIIYSNKKQWNGFQSQKEIYKSNGFSEAEALDRIRDDFNIEKLASSMRNNRRRRR